MLLSYNHLSSKLTIFKSWVGDSKVACGAGGTEAHTGGLSSGQPGWVGQGPGQCKFREAQPASDLHLKEQSGQRSVETISKSRHQELYPTLGNECVTRKAPVFSWGESIGGPPCPAQIKYSLTLRSEGLCLNPNCTIYYRVVFCSS